MSEIELTPDTALDVLRDVPCPACGAFSLVLRMLFVARPPGAYSIAGMQPKVSAIEWPHLVCDRDGCDFKKAAKGTQV